MPLLRAVVVLALTALAATLTLAAAAVVAAGCESEPRRSQVLAVELDKICHAVERADAAGLPEGDRMVQVAVWLDQNIRSDEGLAFLRAFARLGPDQDARRRMLADAARTHGVRDCPLIDFWR